MSKASPCNLRRFRVRVFKHARAHFRQLFLAGPQRLSQEDAEVFQVVFPELFVGLMPVGNPFADEGGSDSHYVMAAVGVDFAADDDQAEGGGS